MQDYLLGDPNERATLGCHCSPEAAQAGESRRIQENVTPLWKVRNGQNYLLKNYIMKNV